MFLMKMGANIREKEATIASTRADTRQKESDVRRAQIEGKIQEQLPPGDMLVFQNQEHLRWMAKHIRIFPCLQRCQREERLLWENLCLL
jgi:hypothetical protein